MTRSTINSRTEQVKALLRDLQQDVKHYQKLSLLLQQQRMAILTCHVTHTETLDSQLMEIYPQLQTSARRRVEILQQLHLPPNSSGIRSLFSRLPLTIKAQAETCWNTLKQLALTCQHLNERNGLLLHSQHEWLTPLLALEGERSYLYHGG